MVREISAFAPATVGNVLIGYDVLGLCLDGWGDTVSLSLNESGEVTLGEVTGDNGVLPRDPTKNVATALIGHLLQEKGISQGITVTLHKGLPVGSGLGSSSASSVGALVALNALLELNLSHEELLSYALIGEELACGARHPDNVTPCLYGGITLTTTERGTRSLPVPADLYATIVHPDFTLLTSEARKVLPSSLPFSNMVQQVSSVAGFITGLYESDYGLIQASLHDYMTEPYRSSLIPRFSEAKAAALSAGALGCGISGAGPSLLALCQGNEVAKQCEKAFQEIYASSQIKTSTLVTKIPTIGARVIQ